MEALNVAQNDVPPDESHHNPHCVVPNARDGSQVFHHASELVELTTLCVPTHSFTKEPTIPGAKSPLSQDQTTRHDSQSMTTDSFSDLDLPILEPANSVHASLGSSIQTTVSSALPETAPSSGSRSTIKTVSSAATSVLSSPSAISDVQELEKGLFADPKMMKKPEDRLAWKKIQPKLKHTIDNIIKVKKNLDPTYSCEFMMGGPSPTQLKPMIILTCCHKEYQTQLKEILEKQKWMASYKYQWHVLVDSFVDLSLGDLDKEHGTSRLLVEAFVPSDKPSWCGLKARAQSRAHQEPARFTIGGILLIDGVAFGLTVKHGIERLIHINAASSDDSNGDDDDDQSATEKSSSPFITTHEGGLVQVQDYSEAEKRALVLGPTTTAPRVYTSITDNNSPEKTQNGSEWHIFGQSNAPDISGSTIICGRLDWSLVKFELQLGCNLSHSSLANTLVTPINDIFETKCFLNTSDMTGGEVWINAGSTGPVKGWLVDCPALLHRHGKSFEVFQVIPDQPLGASI